MIPALCCKWARGGVLLALLVAVLLACGGSDTSAPSTPPAGPTFITGGVPTGTSFGNVGALLVDVDRDGTIDGRVCSGSLIAPTVFLTAAHCIAHFPNVQFYVTFVPDLSICPPCNSIQAEASHFHPDFSEGGLGIAARSDGPYENDLGVVILPTGATGGIAPLQLPPAGYLDALAAHGGLIGQLFLNVGYGADASPQGLPAFSFNVLRKISKSRFKGLTSDWLNLLNNIHATGEGGSCFGDSGSPKFLDGSPTMVLAVTSWGDAVCRGTVSNQRVDTPSARSFLGQYVQLP